MPKARPCPAVRCGSEHWQGPGGLREAWKKWSRPAITLARPEAGLRQWHPSLACEAWKKCSRWSARAAIGLLLSLLLPAGGAGQEAEPAAAESAEQPATEEEYHTPRAGEAFETGVD